MQVSWEIELIESVELYSEMVLKRPCIGHTVKPLLICSSLAGDIAFRVNVIGLFERLCCKGHTGKPLHIHSGHLRDRCHQSSRIVFKRKS